MRYASRYAVAIAFVATSCCLSAEPERPKNELSRIEIPDHAMSYAWKFVPESMLPTERHYDGTNNEAWIYARVFNEAGDQYVLMRFIDNTKSPLVTLSRDGKPDPRFQGDSVFITRIAQAEDGLVFSGDGFDVRISPARVNWSDASGKIKLQGANSAMGNVGLSAMIPYITDERVGIDMYTGQYHPVEGTIFGEKVKGMFVIDHFFGKTSFGNSYLVENEILWFKFANVYEDNTVEIGEFFRLRDGRSGGVVTDGTRLVAQSETPAVKVAYDKSGNVASETWSIGDDHWVMTPDGSGATVLGQTGLKQIWGEVRRKGDHRRLINQFAIAEYSAASLPADLLSKND